MTTVVARGSLATVGTFAHGEAWEGDPDEEAFARPAAIFTTAGRWRFHGRHGSVDVDERVVVFGHAGESYRCSHEGTPDDRTLEVSVLGDYELPPRGSAARSSAHFSRQFRRRLGVLPSRYVIRAGAAARRPEPQALRRAR